MKILIVYKEIREKDDDEFMPKKEEILLKSTIPFTQFRERYEFMIEKPKPKTGTQQWSKHFTHTPMKKPFRFMKEVIGFLANAVSKVN